MEKVTKKIINKFKDEVGMSKGGGGTAQGSTATKGKKREENKKTTAGGEGSDNDEDDEVEEVPFEKKVQFTEKVRRLTNDGLTRLVKKVKDICPNALEDVDDQKLHIKVDDIDKESFDKLDALVDENLKTSKDIAKENLLG